ncbi:MAG: hypothetical protein ACYC99_17375 [Candidatus Geothermincolia bacterium]
MNDTATKVQKVKADMVMEIQDIVLELSKHQAAQSALLQGGWTLLRQVQLMLRGEALDVQLTLF